MAVSFLDFEQPIAELEAKIEELRHVTADGEVNIQDEIGRLQAKSRQLTMSIFASLTPRQSTQPARPPHHPDRRCSHVTLSSPSQALLGVPGELSVVLTII